MTGQGYVPRTSQLLKDFDKSVALAKEGLLARYGQEQADAVVAESRQRYEALIPQIPYIGPRNPLLIFLLPTSRYLALYRALQRHGQTVEDVGQLVYEMAEAEVRAMPRLVRRAMPYLWFSPWFLARLRRRADRSQLREYPGGYVLDFVEGNGRDFDYGIDYRECASCKLLKAQDAMELAPYVCAVDKVTSEMLGWGLSRTTTLAEGGDRCDFRFKKGGKTSVPVPPSLSAS
jgi:hypothetical protein